ncbi:hypothetical protein, partial [Rhizobium johnstonii]|uniref:hypothetical protein n=1 Tax=Rhizobium johnstonii TaxID=3019933 RepID=UPI003F99109B
RASGLRGNTLKEIEGASHGLNDAVGRGRGFHNAEHYHPTAAYSSQMQTIIRPEVLQARVHIIELSSFQWVRV